MSAAPLDDTRSQPACTSCSLPSRLYLHASPGFMSVRLSLLTLVLLLAPPAAVAQGIPTPSDLSDRIERELDPAVFGDAYWGIQVTDLETGRSLYQRNADKRFVPASNMKLLTTAAALDALGPDFRYTTTLFAEGPIREGTLTGSLVVRGSGDPTFGARYTGGDLTLVFRQWADSLKALGVHRITGPVVGDDNVFDDVSIGEGWDWNDLVWYYAPEISGLQFNEGVVRLAVHGTSPGRPARIEVTPDVGYVQVVNRSTTRRSGGVREGYDRALGENVFTVTSAVPRGRTEIEDVAVVNPTTYFVRVMLAVFEQEGIEVDGEPVDVDAWGRSPRYDALTRVAVHRSPALSAIVGETNASSNNLHAEHLLRTLGAEHPDASRSIPGSAASGAAVVLRTLEKMGVRALDVRVADGSGLSALNRVSPRAIVSLLSYMHNHPNGEGTTLAFYRSLAVGGRTGTLRNRYRRGNARGNVRAKTGYIRGARTLSGYVDAANGHRLAFSLLCNQYSTSTRRVEQAQDAIVELLADYDG